MNLPELQKEYTDAGRGWLRAAFGSIVRRHYREISTMDAAGKRAFIKQIGAPATYFTELCKELKTVEYDAIKITTSIKIRAVSAP